MLICIVYLMVQLDVFKTKIKKTIDSYIYCLKKTAQIDIFLARAKAGTHLSFIYIPV